MASGSLIAFETLPEPVRRATRHDIVASWLVVHLQTCGSTGSAVSIGVLGAVVIRMIIIWPMVQIARAQEAADILGQEQEFFRALS